MASDVDAARGDTFAVTLKKWREHQKSMSMIRDILMYMDRISRAHNSLEPVYDLGLSLWRDVVLQDEAINARVRDFLLSAIDAERRGERVDAGAVRAMTRMLMDAGEDARAGGADASAARHRALYRSQSRRRPWAPATATVGLRRAEARLEEEHARVGAYLCARTEAFLVRRAEQELLERPTRRVLGLPNSGLARDAGGEPRRAGGVGVQAVRARGGRAGVREGCVRRSRAGGGQEAGERPRPERGPRAVRGVSALLEAASGRDGGGGVPGGSRIRRRRTRAPFETFVNLNARSPEFLSLYVDDKLRKGLKGVSEEETESVLDRAASLFRFLQEKGVFERYYKQHLSKRLLFGRSASDDAEKAFIVRLKTECGYQYTSKIEGMFNDMRVSRDAMSLFRKHLARRSADWRNTTSRRFSGARRRTRPPKHTEKTQSRTRGIHENIRTRSERVPTRTTERAGRST